MVPDLKHPTPDAYLVSLPNNFVPASTVFLDLSRAIDYAAQHHGTVKALYTAENHPRKDTFK